MPQKILKDIEKGKDIMKNSSLRTLSITLILFMAISLIFLSGCEKAQEPAAEPEPEPLILLAPKGPISLELFANTDGSGVVLAVAIETDRALEEEGAGSEEEDSEEGPVQPPPSIMATWGAPLEEEGRLSPDGYAVTLLLTKPDASILDDPCEEGSSETENNENEGEGSEAEAGLEEGIDEEASTTLSIEVNTKDTSYTFEDLFFATEYKVTVKAYAKDPLTGEVKESGEIEDTVTTGVPDLKSPLLRAEGTSQTDICLAWDEVLGATGYIIRCGPKEEGITDKLIEVCAHVKEYVNSGLGKNTTVFYTIAALYGAHEYPVSEAVSAATKSPAIGGASGGTGSSGASGGAAGGGGGGGGANAQWYYFAQCGAQFASAGEAEWHAGNAHSYVDADGWTVFAPEKWGGQVATSPAEAYAILKAQFGW